MTQPGAREPESAANLRPNPLFADITLIESRATSRYNAFQVRYQQRPSNGMSLLLSYTLGKSTDDASGFFTSAGDPNFPQNSLDPGAERGRSSFDVRHRFSAALTQPLPFEPGQLLGQLGDHQSSIQEHRWRARRDCRAAGHSPCAAAGHRQQQHRPLEPRVSATTIDRTSAATPSLNGAHADRLVQHAAFSMPPFGTFGNSGRNTLRGPRSANLNLALVKHLRVNRRPVVDLRGEAFNVTNRVNYDLPDAFFG